MNITQTLKNSLILLSLVVTISSVWAHSNVVYDQNLDFDPVLKEKVIQVAQDYLQTEESPLKFDYDRELIKVQFESPLELWVAINPGDYSVAGFRDDTLVSRTGNVRLDQSARKQKAQSIFDTVAPSNQAEMVYGGEQELYTGTFKHTWFRTIDNIVVANEALEVEVDGVSGEIVSWKLSVFWTPADKIKTAPAINHNVAEYIAQLRFEAEAVDFDPILLINRDKPVWVVKIKKLYPQFVWVDALDGRVLATGGLRTEIPEGYDYGRGAEVVETSFIQKVREGSK